MGGPSALGLGAGADYAIRALAEIARADRAPTADQIAAAQDIPKAFLTVILSQLGRAQIVRARRGRQGGYLLTRPPEAISMAEVLAAVHEPDAVPVLDDGHPYERLRGRLFDVIESLTLADLLAEA